MDLKKYTALNRGGATRLAAALGIDKSYLSQMASKTRPISPTRCLLIERETNGAVTRQDLRPNDYWLIWPDLKAPETETV